MQHIELARWADLILVAPASADFMARLAQGLADDLLTTLCLASTAPIALAPAMNRQMWLNAATQANCRRLAGRGVLDLGSRGGVAGLRREWPGPDVGGGDVAAAGRGLFYARSPARGAGIGDRRSHPGADRSGAFHR